MFIVVLKDGETWDLNGFLIEISEEEYNKINESGELGDLKCEREIDLLSVVEDDGEGLKNIRSEDLDPVFKSHRRELVNRVIANVYLGNVDEVVRIAGFLKK